MAASGRGSLRPYQPSRLPFFVVFGLIIAFLVLGYNYWDVALAKAQLSSDVSKLQVVVSKLRRTEAEVKSCTEKVAEIDAEKRKHELSDRKNEQDLEDTRREVADYKSQVQQLKTELNKMQSERDTCLSEAKEMKLKAEENDEKVDEKLVEVESTWKSKMDDALATANKTCTELLHSIKASCSSQTADLHAQLKQLQDQLEEQKKTVLALESQVNLKDRQLRQHQQQQQQQQQQRQQQQTAHKPENSQNNVANRSAAELHGNVSENPTTDVERKHRYSTSHNVNESSQVLVERLNAQNNVIKQQKENGRGTEDLQLPHGQPSQSPVDQTKEQQQRESPIESQHQRDGRMMRSELKEERHSTNSTGYNERADRFVSQQTQVEQRVLPLQNDVNVTSSVKSSSSHRRRRVKPKASNRVPSGGINGPAAVAEPQPSEQLRHSDKETLHFSDHFSPNKNDNNISSSNRRINQRPNGGSVNANHIDEQLMFNGQQADSRRKDANSLGAPGLRNVGNLESRTRTKSKGYQNNADEGEQYNANGI